MTSVTTSMTSSRLTYFPAPGTPCRNSGPWIQYARYIPQISTGFDLHFGYNIIVLEICYFKLFMMTSSNGNIFRVTGPLWGESTGDRWISLTKALTRSFHVFFDLFMNKRLSKQSRRRWFETPSCSLWRDCQMHCLQWKSTLGGLVNWRIDASHGLDELNWQQTPNSPHNLT